MNKLAAPVLATLASVAVGLTSGTATAAEEPARSRVTVSPSDYNPSVGEQFVLRGRMTSLGEPVPDVPVRVQTYRAGGWVALRGAVVTTDGNGRYRVRVILGQGGDRDLRVVANPVGGDIRTARAYTVVRAWK